MSEHSCEHVQERLAKLEAETVDWNQVEQSAGNCEDCRAQVGILRLLHEDARNQPQVHLDRERLDRLRAAVKPHPRRFLPYALLTAAAAAVVAVFVVLSGANESTRPIPVIAKAAQPSAAELDRLANDEPMAKRLHIIQRRSLIDFNLGPVGDRVEAGNSTSQRMRRLRTRMRVLRAELTSS